jgi:hypothetical protein
MRRKLANTSSERSVQADGQSTAVIVICALLAVIAALLAATAFTSPADQLATQPTDTAVQTSG